MEFRAMRRKNQELSPADCDAVLRRGSHGVLAVCGDGGWPYAVPVNYVWADGRLFFHCAKAGHKLDAIAGEPRVSLCVVDADELVPAEFTSYFRSVIVFGRARVLTDPAQRRAALALVARRFGPGDPAEDEKELDRTLARVCLVEIEIAHMTGKQAIELVRREAGGAQ